jgi:hypothetical protein
MNRSVSVGRRDAHVRTSVCGLLRGHRAAVKAAATPSAHPPIALRAAAAAAAPRPVLLIAARDAPDEAHAARHIQHGNPSVQVWQVPRAGHTQALYTYPGEWEQRVTAFLATALTQPAVPGQSKPGR